MSNPLINRWGTNLFWYNMWYTDKNQASSIHQDLLIAELISTYTNFGLFQKKHIFVSNYWFKKNTVELNKINIENDLKYFQLMEHKNKITDEITKFKLRKRIKRVYNSKLWILRYQSWIVFNLYSFQPITKKRKIIIKLKEKNFGLEEKNKIETYKSLLIRYKLFILLFNKSFSITSSYYLF